MELTNFVSFCLFAFTSAFTPGPNNLMLAASAATFGFRATWPHILGITVGFNLMVVVSLLGLNELFSTFPMIHSIARYAAFLFLLHLTYKIATATAPQHPVTKEPQANTGSQPIGFWSGALFQIINPKGVIVIISAITAYTDVTNGISASHMTFSGIFIFVTITSTTLWSYGGSLIGRALSNPRHLKAFNLVMAGLLLGAVAPVLMTSLTLT